MVLKILKYPNPLLRKKSEEIKEITPKIRQLALDMAQTMLEGRGIGLAAPQVGELKRIIVIQEGESQKVLINPRIIKKSNESVAGEEGCLCFPGIYLTVNRPSGVEAQAINLEGEKIQLKAEGLPARILLHEIDHLDGILIIDKIGFWQRLKLQIKLKRAR